MPLLCSVHRQLAHDSRGERHRGEAEARAAIFTPLWPRDRRRLRHHADGHMHCTVAAISLERRKNSPRWWLAWSGQVLEALSLAMGARPFDRINAAARRRQQELVGWQAHGGRYVPSRPSKPLDRHGKRELSGPLIELSGRAAPSLGAGWGVGGHSLSVPQSCRQCNICPRRAAPAWSPGGAATTHTRLSHDWLADEREHPLSCYSLLPVDVVLESLWSSSARWCARGVGAAMRAWARTLVPHTRAQRRACSVSPPFFARRATRQRRPPGRSRARPPAAGLPLRGQRRR